MHPGRSGTSDDGQRYELVDGQLLVTPAPSDVHQLVVTALAARLYFYFRDSRVGRVLVSPADVRRGDRTRNRVQPDVFVARLTEGRLPANPYDTSDLLLAAEVESPSRPAYDYQTKRALYLSNGIPEYWILSPADLTLRVRSALWSYEVHCPTCVARRATTRAC